MIREFREQYYFLSNFSNIGVVYEGIRYHNVEAAFQAQKSHDIKYKQELSKLPAHIAKARGRKVKLRPDWEEVKDNIMYEIIKAKFNPLYSIDASSALINTGDMYLEEGNTCHDNYWGNCSCNKCKNIQGKNKLGLILMQVRQELLESTKIPSQLLQIQMKSYTDKEEK